MAEKVPISPDAKDDAKEDQTDSHMGAMVVSPESSPRQTNVSPYTMALTPIECPVLDIQVYQPTNSGFPWLEVGACIASGVLVGIVVTPFAAWALGFGSTGIAAGSIAAWMMSATAIANGGAVPALSLVAGLQSIGAVGFLTTTTSGLLVFGGAGAAGGALGFGAYHGKKALTSYASKAVAGFWSGISTTIVNLFNFDIVPGVCNETHPMIQEPEEVD